MGTTLGTAYKMNVSVDGLVNMTLADVDFRCTFYVYTGKELTLEKSEMVRVDNDNYLAVFDSAKLGRGNIKMRMSLDIPDSDCPDGVREEIYTINTGVKIE